MIIGITRGATSLAVAVFGAAAGAIREVRAIERTLAEIERLQSFREPFARLDVDAIRERSLTSTASFRDLLMEEAYRLRQ